MKAILLSGWIFFSNLLSAGPEEVYICNNNKVEKYHKSATCRGLGNCQFKIVKISVQSAKNKGLTLCGWESKKKK